MKNHWRHLVSMLIYVRIMLHRQRTLSRIVIALHLSVSVNCLLENPRRSAGRNGITGQDMSDPLRLLVKEGPSAVFIPGYSFPATLPLAWVSTCSPFHFSTQHPHGNLDTGHFFRWMPSFEP